MEEIKTEFEIINQDQEKPSRWKPKEPIGAPTILRHILLFILTLASVTFMGYGFFMSYTESALFAVFLLAFLTTHEFGHFYAAVYHRISATLPYFIPLPLLSPIGTLGAVIRIKEPLRTTKILFDVGVSGPIAGFIVSMILLITGFLTLPSPDYMLQFPGHSDLHEYIRAYGTYPDHPFPDEQGVLMLGHTFLFSFMALFFENVPPMWEMYHFPLLFSGWLGLLFTAINLIPIGQLDGGHILYALIGRKNHRTVARISLGVLSVLAGIGAIPILNELLRTYAPKVVFLSWAIWGSLLFAYFLKVFQRSQVWTVSVGTVSLILTFIFVNLLGDAASNGYSIWIVWMLLIAYMIKVDHPPVMYEQRLSPFRKQLGWFSMLIFILCISPNPLYFYFP